MKTFEEIAPEIFEQLEDGRLVYQFGPLVEVFVDGRNELTDTPRFQLELEPIAFGGGYLVALYENDPDEPYPVLMWPGKLPILPILRTTSRQPAGDPPAPGMEATQRQLRYLQAVAREAGLTARQLDQLTQRHYGCLAVQLSRRDCSACIDLIQNASPEKLRALTEAATDDR